MTIRLLMELYLVWQWWINAKWFSASEVTTLRHYINLFIIIIIIIPEYRKP